MLVYKETMSHGDSITLGGHLIDILLSIKSVESLTYEGNVVAIDCKHISTNCEIFSVALAQDETMGLIPGGFLCIFLRKYSLAVFTWARGRQYLYCSSLSFPVWYRIFSLQIIEDLIGIDISLSTLLYTDVSAR